MVVVSFPATEARFLATSPSGNSLRLHPRLHFNVRGIIPYPYSIICVMYVLNILMKVVIAHSWSNVIIYKLKKFCEFKGGNIGIVEKA